MVSIYADAKFHERLKAHVKSLKPRMSVSQYFEMLAERAMGAEQTNSPGVDAASHIESKTFVSAAGLAAEPPRAPSRGKRKPASQGA